MENPIDLWRKATSSEKWKTLKEEDKKALQTSFREKYKDLPDKDRAGIVAASSLSSEEIFNLPEFENADDETKKKYLKGYIYASKGVTGNALDYFAEGGLRKYKGAASVAGLKRMALSANRLRQGISAGLGISTPEDIARTDLALEQANKEAARVPEAALAAEVLGNVAIGGASGIYKLGRGAFQAVPYVRNIAPVIGGAAGAAGQSLVTEPVAVKGGTPEERSQAYQREKIQQAINSAVFSVGGDILTSPKLRETLGDLYRWLPSRTAKGRIADIADDVLRAEKQRLENVAADITPTRKQVSRGIQTQRAALENAPESVLYTGVPAPALKEVQTSQAGGIAKGAIETQLTAPAIKEAETIAARKYADISTPLKNYKDELWGSAREKILNRKVPNVLEGLGSQLGKILDTDSAVQNSVAQMPEVREILENTIGEKAARNVTVDQLISWQRNILQAKTNNPGGTEALNAIANVLESPLNPLEKAKVKQLYQVSDDLDKVAGGATKAVKYVLSKETPKADLDRIIANPTTLKPLQTALAADITTTLNTTAATQETKDLALSKLFLKYRDSADIVRKVFKDDKEVRKMFDTLMERGKASAQIQKAFAISDTASEANRAARNVIAGGTADIAGRRTLTLAGAYDAARDFFNRKTNELIRASFTNKKLGLDILREAEKIQKNRVNYVQLWDDISGVRGASRRFAASGSVVPVEVVAGEMPIEPEPSLQVPEPAPAPQENLTNAIGSDKIEETLNSININPEFAKTVYEIAGIESNFNPDTDLKNPISSAQGPFQIIEGTWDYVTKSKVTNRDGAEVAGLGLEAALGRPLDKNNPADHALVAAAYMRKNYEELTNAGIKGSAPNLYVAHAWGLNGAKKLFKYRGKNVAIEDIMSMEAIAGHPKFAKPGMTVDQVLNNTIKYFKDRRNNKGKSALIEAVNDNVS
jgi:hypothetical protein